MTAKGGRKNADPSLPLGMTKREWKIRQKQKRDSRDDNGIKEWAFPKLRSHVIANVRREPFGFAQGKLWGTKELYFRHVSNEARELK
jgi:hypothetical protein